MFNLTDEYRTIASRAGWARRIDRGHVKMVGRDVTAFLQALLTNDVSTLVPGDGVWAAYLTPQGRMITDLALLRTSDGVLASVPADRTQAVADQLEQSVFSEDVHISDVSADTTELIVVGPSAAALLSPAFGLDLVPLLARTELSHVAWVDGIVACAGESLLPSLSVIAPASRQAAILSRLASAGIPEMSDALVDALRIAAGRPRFGADMGPDTIPLEAGLLDRAISTTKGCYVGQEIIVRILHRGAGRVARRLVTLSVRGGPMPAAGTLLEQDGRSVGVLTSVAPDPVADGVVALGYVQRESASAGQTFLVAGHSGAQAVVTGFAH